MKKIIALAAAVMLFQGALWAQKEKAVAEKDVNVNYVKDFQRQVKDASEVQWWLVDSGVFKATYLDAEKSRQAMVFSNKGTETHYFVERQYYPAAIKDTVKSMFPKYSIDDVWVRKVRGKLTYQARISKRSGFLWWKKEVDAKLMNFEVDGKFVNVM